jgi:hypothetical protein
MSTTITIEEADAIIKSLTSQLIEAKSDRNRLRAHIQTACDLFRSADEERLQGVHAAQKEAEKWKSEDDWHGWNFHQGKASGMTESSIIFHRVLRGLKSALKQA